VAGDAGKIKGYGTDGNTELHLRRHELFGDCDDTINKKRLSIFRRGVLRFPRSHAKKQKNSCDIYIEIIFEYHGKETDKAQ
jgi:hypothetical protein